ncbi:MAG: hypothetical protein ABIO70_06485 [Pseudomonadota bacterium]
MKRANAGCASYNFGDWASFDADGDGDDEYISSSAVAYYAADITVLDPSAGLSSGSAVTRDGLLVGRRLRRRRGCGPRLLRGRQRG